MVNKSIACGNKKTKTLSAVFLGALKLAVPKETLI